jgi:hypothetical protein
VVAHVDALARGHAEPEEPCHIVGGPRISVETLKNMAKDAFVTALVHDGVDVTHYKRYGKNIPVTLKLLLAVGDPPHFAGARCPCCKKRFRLQIDHVDPRSNGGRTEYRNLQVLCPACHQRKTEEDRRAGRHRGAYGVNHEVVNVRSDPDRGPPELF